MLLSQSGMTHISLVLMFTYVNDNSKLRTDGAGSLLLSHNVHFSFSGQTTAMHYYALQSEMHWCSEPYTGDV